MALLAREMLDAVLAIGVRTAMSSISWIGTGFLIGYRYGPAYAEGNAYYTYFVTAKHVVRDLVPRGIKTIIARCPAVDSKSAVDLYLDLEDSGKSTYSEHPKNEVDVVAFPVMYQVIKDKGAASKVLPSDSGCWNLREMQAAGISEGDGIFLLGYPLGLVDDTLPFAIARSGSIARIRDVYADPSRDYLVDTNLFPGGSGGPVCTKPEIAGVGKSQVVDQSRCIGMLTRARTFEDIAISSTTNTPRLVLVENAGLADVVPMDRIYYILEKDLQARDSAGTLPKPASEKIQSPGQ